ncbi:hypothetical protein MUY35_00905 [Aliiroseovarius sp. S1339]|uniref:hypothetical protein n=1 Tax=Aliiroseovarius sp. S1339 TaxID=2936990 RepID=UPI0020BEAB8F|nr:hypothetical protein [Aliiroseovarius sp. S1339]MCK8462404.1 hypothetical protein [Aliiroseovarius sp. S1339]
MSISGLSRLLTHLVDRNDRADEDTADLLDHMAKLSSHICEVWKANIDALEILSLEADGHRKRRDNVPFKELLATKDLSLIKMAQARRANGAEVYEFIEIEKTFETNPDATGRTSIRSSASTEQIEKIRRSARSIYRKREDFRREFDEIFDDISEESFEDFVARLDDTDVSVLRKKHDRMQRQASKIAATSRKYRASIRN